MTIPNRWRWSLWCIGLTVWTALLLTPGNWFFDVTPKEGFGFPFGKLLHVSAYAGLGAGVGWLCTSTKYRLWLIMALIAHGGLTELTQLIVPFRDGSLADWALDTASILTGWALVRWWWPR